MQGQMEQDIAAAAAAVCKSVCALKAVHSALQMNSVLLYHNYTSENNEASRALNSCGSEEAICSFNRRNCL